MMCQYDLLNSCLSSILSGSIRSLTSFNHSFVFLQNKMNSGIKNEMFCNLQCTAAHVQLLITC